MSLHSPHISPAPNPNAGADAIPASPPAEVLDAVAAAWDAYDRLEASGHRLHFATHPVTGRLTVELEDLEHNLLGILPVGTVLDVATTGTLG